MSERTGTLLDLQSINEKENSVLKGLSLILPEDDQTRREVIQIGDDNKVLAPYDIWTFVFFFSPFFVDWNVDVCIVEIQSAPACPLNDDIMDPEYIVLDGTCFIDELIFEYRLLPWNFLYFYSSILVPIKTIMICVCSKVTTAKNL